MPTSIEGILAGIAAIVTAFGGAWAWLQSRYKAKAEAATVVSRAAIEANASIMAGFIQLIGEFRTERVSLITRLQLIEQDNIECDRRVSILERTLVSHGIMLPEEGMRK